MTSPRRLRLTAEARRNLRSILRHSLRAWGEHRRDTYADRLTAAMDGLVTYPELGRRRDDIAPGLRSLPVGEHVFYYRVDERTVTVSRILHQKMDAPARFDDPD